MRRYVVTLLCIELSLASAPFGWHNVGAYPPSDQAGEMKSQLFTLKTQVTNQESEIKQLKEKLATQSEVFDSLQDDVQRQQKNGKESTKLTQLSDDIQKIKAHANELTDHVGETKKKLASLQDATEKQNAQIAQLEKAVHILMDALGVNEPTAPGEKYYTVKSGDSLGEIAIKNKTTVETLRKLNNMTNDKIIVGKKLRLPSDTNSKN